MRPIHTVEYYSTVQRNEPPIYATTWMKLENTMLSEKPEQKATYCLIPFIRNPEKANLWRKNQTRGCQELGGEGNGE